MIRRPLLAVLAALAAAACNPAVSTPTPSPPIAPTIRLGDWTASNGHWTFTATVNPRDSPTDVALEWGFGGEAAPAFNNQIPVETGLLEAGVVSASVDIGEAELFCVRFVATNGVGSATSEPYCSEPLRSVIVVPGPTEPHAALGSP